MKLFLRLPHWVVFLLIYGALLIFFFYPEFEYMFQNYMHYAAIVMFFTGTLAWIWSIGTVLHRCLHNEIKLSLRVFNVCVIAGALAAFFVLTNISSGTFSGRSGHGYAIGLSFEPLFMAVNFIAGILFILSIRFAAKVMKSVELGREAKWNEYVGEFFWMWFSMLGVWSLQPRLNDLVGKTVKQ